LWNFNEWAVAAFIFCSFYIFFYQQHNLGITDFLQHIVKRLERLLVPYFYFLSVFLLITAYFEPQKIKVDFILSSIFLMGGVDINWLILLFVILTFIISPLMWLKNH